MTASGHIDNEWWPGGYVPLVSPSTTEGSELRSDEHRFWGQTWPNPSPAPLVTDSPWKSPLSVWRSHLSLLVNGRVPELLYGAHLGCTESSRANRGQRLSEVPITRIGFAEEAVGCVLRIEPPICEHLHSVPETEEGGAWSTAAGRCSQSSQACLCCQRVLRVGAWGQGLVCPVACGWNRASAQESFLQKEEEWVLN